MRSSVVKNFTEEILTSVNYYPIWKNFELGQVHIMNFITIAKGHFLIKTIDFRLAINSFKDH